MWTDRPCPLAAGRLRMLFGMPSWEWCRWVWGVRAALLCGPALGVVVLSGEE